MIYSTDNGPHENTWPDAGTTPFRSEKNTNWKSSDDGDVLGLRFDNWKIVFMEQRVRGTLQIWAEPFVPLRVPKLFNLRTDPYEHADVTIEKIETMLTAGH